MQLYSVRYMCMDQKNHLLKKFQVRKGEGQIQPRYNSLTKILGKKGDPD